MDERNDKLPKDENFLERLDLCISDIVYKSGLGLFFGFMLAKFCFPGRRWPPITGIAVGSSNAWARCRITTLYKNTANAIDEPTNAEEVEEAVPEDDDDD